MAHTHHQASLDKKSSKQDPTASLSTIADETEALNIDERQGSLYMRPNQKLFPIPPNLLAVTHPILPLGASRLRILVSVVF